MNRRNFIASVMAMAGTVLLDKGGLKSLQAGNQWNYLKITEPRAVQDSNVWVQYLIGRRTDGKWFYVQIPNYKEYALNPDIRRRDEENGRQTLDTFLDCSCGEDGQCPLHQEMFRYTKTELHEVDDASL